MTQVSSMFAHAASHTSAPRSMRFVSLAFHIQSFIGVVVCRLKQYQQT